MTRDEAIYVLKKNYPDESLREAINVAIETLEQEYQKKGRWLMNTGIGTICSNCFYKLETTGLLSYCPRCGAKMDLS